MNHCWERGQPCPRESALPRSRTRLSAGTFGHGGAYGTQGWIDPKQDLILILMIRRAKLPNADASDVRRAFQEAAVAAVIPSQ